MSDLGALAKERLEAAARNAVELAGGDAPELAARAAGILADTLREGGTILFCGNGGSAADAQHLAAELVGKMSVDRPPMRAVALTTDTSALTAIANDYGFDEVFERQVKALARSGDTLVALSTSGRSANVLRAARAARAAGAYVVALTGPEDSVLADQADVVLRVPGGSSAEIQQSHIALGHVLCELAEAAAN